MKKSKETKPTENKNLPKEKDGNPLVHFWWIIGTLLLIIVLLAALLCTNIQMFEHKIMTFLSFTATLLSIILSIFAIMYSFYSMKESSRQWMEVTTAVKSIEAYTDILSKSTQQMVDQVIKINKDLASMQEKIKASNEMPQSAKDNPKNIENMVNFSHVTPRVVSRIPKSVVVNKE